VIYINVVCDITVDFWFVIYICFVVYIEKQKTKKIVFKVAFPSAWAATLGEENFFPECLGCGSRGRGRLLRVPGLWLSGKRVSSPSATAVALGEEGVFSDCCTRGRFF